MNPSLPTAVLLPAILEAIESAGLGCSVVVVRDDRMERVYANETLARIMGIDLPTLNALPPLDILPPSERARLAELAAARKGDARPPAVLETVIRRPDGIDVPVEVALGRAVLDGARAVFAFIRDVSPKAAMERALRDSEELFRLVAEASPDSIGIHKNGRYVYANPVALRHLGLASLEDVAGMDSKITVGEERRAIIDDIATRVLAGEKVPPYEVRRPGAGGKETIFEASMTGVSMGGERAIVSYTRDITDRVLMQAELMKRDRLASVGLLAAGIAHELNNPLTSLGIQARKLREDADAHGFSAEVRGSLEQMEQASAQMSAIIQDLLFMARPVEQAQAHVDVAQILKSTIALFRAGTPACPPIETAVDPLPPIQGYPPKLGQVFSNLLRNAAQALEGVAGARIDVRGRALGDAIEIAFSDNGPGMSSDVLERVMQPFFTTKPHGTGLGLWISQTLVALHDGSLEIRSEPGNGTTAVVRLRGVGRAAPPR